jgi:magnesium chelatase family protein
MSDEQVSRFCALDSAGRSLLAAATEKLGLSPSTTGRILRVARSVADLEGAEAIRTVHLAEALQFRPLRHPRHV